MNDRYEIEMNEPASSRCECCGSLTVKLTRFVYRDGDAFAVYYAQYSNNHPDHDLEMLISIGEWDEHSEPSQRSAFYCRVRSNTDSYAVSLEDASGSPWSDSRIMGAMLSRAEALAHPLKSTAFEVLDEALLRDRLLTGFIDRAQSGDAAIPLERNFQKPDAIFALGAEAEERAEVQEGFAHLDGKRFFLRCLLPIPVEGYDTWSIGLWVEVSEADFEMAQDVWNDEERYRRLRFDGRIANDVGGDLDLPVRLGDSVRVHVVDPKSAPMVEAPRKGDLAALMSNTWPKADFEKYAIARGLL